MSGSVRWGKSTFGHGSVSEIFRSLREGFGIPLVWTEGLI